MEMKYRIQNFKAFSDSGTIKLSPITVLCGVNSAGKSSIIKSILLAKQSSAVRRSSFSSSIPSQPLILNGEFTKLGSWSDTITLRDRNRRLHFYWSLQASRKEYNDFLLRANIRPVKGTRTKRVEKNKNVELSVTVSSNPSVTEELSIRVEEWLLNIEGCIIKISRSEDETEHEEELYKIEIDNPKKLLAREGAQLGRYTLYLGDTIKAVASEEERITLGNVAVSTSGPFISSIRPCFDGSWGAFFSSIYDIAERHRGVKRGPTPKWITQLQNAARNYRKSTDLTNGEATRSPAARSLLFLAVELVEDVSRAFSETKAVLAPMWRDIRYLGPLRDQPRRYYQFDDTGGADVGVSGEFTVQVLALEKSRELTASRVEDVSSDGITFSDPILGSLLEHTNHWLDFMSLPSVSPSSLEQSLYKLEVGDLGVGLLDVGFGVSQVLPIVVEALRAEPGDLVILEQPEIHLHPKVQAKLGDFLIARSRDGVRFLVESHSEYLIKRLCRRLAEAQNDKMTELSNILFVEGAPGNASCKRIIVNSFGEIENWPMGFFDLDEDLHWVKATLKKRENHKISRG